MGLKPIGSIKADLGINPDGRIQKFFVDTCYRYMNKYVPEDTGDLRNNVRKGKDYIIYESPYAHAQYVGIVNGSPVRNYTTPGTGSYWAERMKSADMENVIKEVQEEINRGK